MNVKELKEMLDLYPDELEVWSFCAGYGNSFPTQREDVSLEIEKDGEKRKVILLIGQK